MKTSARRWRIIRRAERSASKPETGDACRDVGALPMGHAVDDVEEHDCSPNSCDRPEWRGSAELPAPIRRFSFADHNQSRSVIPLELLARFCPRGKTRRRLFSPATPAAHGALTLFARQRPKRRPPARTRPPTGAPRRFGRATNVAALRAIGALHVPPFARSAPSGIGNGISLAHSRSAVFSAVVAGVARVSPPGPAAAAGIRTKRSCRNISRRSTSGIFPVDTTVR